MNVMASRKFLSVINPIKERYIFVRVLVLVVKGLLKQSIASSSNNYMILFRGGIS